MKHNWSAEEVLEVGVPIMKKIQIFKALNKIDTLIWIKGLGGMLIVLRKYVIQAMTLRSVAVFFDFCVLFNVIVLCL